MAAYTVASNNSVYSSVDGVLFDENQKTLIQYPGGRVGCYSMPNSVTSIADGSFSDSSGLTGIIIPNSVTNIGIDAFSGCNGLTNLTIPGSVTFVADQAFYFCDGLTAIYFQGNAPTLGTYYAFAYAFNATVFYRTNEVGFSGPTYDGLPAVLWNPQAQTAGPAFGVRTNTFGFNITGNSNLVVVVEVSPVLSNPIWSPVSTNILTNGSCYFSDSQWTNYPARFYRLNMP
jgi:hypothetical protein